MNIGIRSFMKSLRRLNPTITFETPDVSASDIPIILGNVSAEGLRFPRNYYYDKASGVITNKSSKGGMYENFHYMHTAL